MSQEESIILAQHIAQLQQEVTAIHKKNQALQRQIQALISAQLTTINAGFVESSAPETAKQMRAAAVGSLEALKQSILKSTRS